jgi:hypothetical protein
LNEPPLLTKNILEELICSNIFDEPPLPTDVFDGTPVIAENILDEPLLTSSSAFPPLNYVALPCVALSAGCMLTV